MQTLFIGQKLQVFEELQSTNTYLKEHINKNQLTEGFTVRSKHQTLGRGQIGNIWHDEPGRNLLFSIYLKPKFLSAVHFFKLNMSVCLAIVEVLNQYHPGFQIKWPNDILFKRKKVCGILIENTISKSRIESSVVGVGVNVNQKNFPNDAAAISMQQLMPSPLMLKDMFVKLLKQIEVEYLRLQKDDVNLLGRYLDKLYGRDNPVPVLYNGEERMLTIETVSEQGHLIAKLGKERHTFNFKEVSFIR
jgi:BirA family biotin operon repressor/biotin-[acetyl-CoA-carboxylase] ligase